MLAPRPAPADARRRPTCRSGSACRSRCSTGSCRPGSSRARRRRRPGCELVRRITDAGLPCGVMVAPVLPLLTDSAEALDALLARIAAAGATGATVLALHLRPGTREWFLAWLAREHPRAGRAVRPALPAGGLRRPGVPPGPGRAGRAAAAPPRARPARSRHCGAEPPEGAGPVRPEPDAGASRCTAPPPGRPRRHAGDAARAASAGGAVEPCVPVSRRGAETWWPVTRVSPDSLEP